MPQLDQQKLDAFLGQFVQDLGATLHAGLIVLGHRLGLYKALAEADMPLSADDLAKRTNTTSRYVEEWLAAQAASGYVTYHPETETFSLTPEQAFALASPDGPYLPGAFRLALSVLRAEDALVDRFRSGRGLGWHEHHDGLFEGTELFFRPSYVTHLTTSWIPALTGVEERLVRGALVADVGCGHGASTILMAQSYPQSQFRGFDYHVPSVEWARQAADRAGVADRVTFEVAPAKRFPGENYDLVTFFDCLHDMGDPVGAAAHARAALAPGGVWMIVEPMAGDHLEDNINPIGRIYYSASTMICTPASLSQEVGLALGAQAGEARLRDVLRQAGFSEVRRAAETPFNIVLEARG
ncbi:MAG: methyltransferase domain-containing protein [Vicinamibacterales bacterium]